MNGSEIKYLELLAKSFPSIPATAAEIVRLQAILELPKTTEHFMSDIHGEYTYFSHILKNASGAIHDKINDSFGDLLGEEEKNSLARLLYYPERELAAAAHSDSWYRVTIHRLVAVCRQATDKYTRVKVRARLPKEYAYIIEELIDSDEHDPNKRKYFESRNGAETLHIILYKPLLCNRFFRLLAISPKTAEEKRQKSNLKPLTLYKYSFILCPT